MGSRLKRMRGIDAALDYLIQWGLRQMTPISVTNHQLVLYDDFMYSEVGDFEYRMGWSLYYGYVGLERVITE